jgi:hypothetical protein
MYAYEDPAIGYAMAHGYGPPQPEIWQPISWGNDEIEEEDDEDGDW